ncbi:MAG TPA: hypothetical protein VFA33_14145 [Bryobacteraceae bacterium]|nr:hypothetical protein [Bryobacteraceae bacterium]
MSRAGWLWCALLLVVVAVSCGRKNSAEVDAEVTSLGTVEVTAQVEEIPGAFPPNDLYNYAYVLKYRVLKVHRGQLPGQEILVAQYNPLKPRTTVADDVSGKVGGHVEAFRAGDIHRMALAAPVDQFWMGGIIDKYFQQPGVRYWAIWTNPGSR